MNKKVLIILTAIVVVVGAGAAFFITNGNDDTAKTNSSEAAGDGKFAAIKACDLFTLNEAKAILGQSAAASEQSEPASGDDTYIDTCSYTNKATNVPDIRVATVTVRSGLTKVGVDSNKAAFDEGGAVNQPSAEAVDGYGSKAFWDTGMKQLSILKDNTLISVVYGGTNTPANTLEDAKKVADVVAK